MQVCFAYNCRQHNPEQLHNAIPAIWFFHAGNSLVPLGQSTLELDAGGPCKCKWKLHLNPVPENACKDSPIEKRLENLTKIVAYRV